MKTEKDLQDYTIRKAKKLNLLAFKLESKSGRGFPDVGLYGPGGSHMLIEVKTPAGNGSLSIHQVETIRDLMRLNVTVAVVDTQEQADRAIDEFIRRAR